MTKSKTNNALEQIVQQWDLQQNKFSEWCGIGQCKEDRFKFFLKSKKPSAEFVKLASEFDVAIEFEQIPQFSKKPQSFSLSNRKLIKIGGRSDSLKLGTAIIAYSTNQKCISGCAGMGGAFFQFIPCNNDHRIWMASCAHILARAGNCAPTHILDMNLKFISKKQKISIVPPVPLPAHPLLDVAVAELDNPTIADPAYAPLIVKSGTPTKPIINGKVLMLKNGRLLEGEILCTCPRMCIGNCDDKGRSPRSDLIMIGSTQGKAPFVVESSDSGSLVVSDDGQPVAIISAGAQSYSGSPLAFATVLSTALPQLEDILRKTSNAPREAKLQVMLKKCP